MYGGTFGRSSGRRRAISEPLGEHPPLDRISKATKAIELQFKEPRIIIERLGAPNGDDEIHSRTDSGSAAKESRFPPCLRGRRNGASGLPAGFEARDPPNVRSC